MDTRVILKHAAKYSFKLKKLHMLYLAGTEITTNISIPEKEKTFYTQENHPFFFFKETITRNKGKLFSTSSRILLFWEKQKLSSSLIHGRNNTSMLHDKGRKKRFFQEAIRAFCHKFGKWLKSVWRLASRRHSLLQFILDWKMTEARSRVNTKYI